MRAGSQSYSSPAGSQGVLAVAAATEAGLGARGLGEQADAHRVLAQGLLGASQRGVDGALGAVGVERVPAGTVEALHELRHVVRRLEALIEIKSG